MFQSPVLGAPRLSALHTPSSSPSHPASMVCPPSPARASPTQENSSPTPRGSGESPEAASLDRASQGCSPANEDKQTPRNRNSVHGRVAHSAGQRELAEEEVSGPAVQRESVGYMDTSVNGGDVLYQTHQKGNDPSLSFTRIASLNPGDLFLQGQGCVLSSPAGKLDNIPVQSCNSTSEETRCCHRKDSLEKLEDIPLALETLDMAAKCPRSPGDAKNVGPAVSPLDNRNDNVTFMAGGRDSLKSFPCFLDYKVNTQGDDIRNGNLCSEGREMDVNDNSSGKIGAFQRRLERFLDHVKIIYRSEAQNEANLMRFRMRWGPSDLCDFPQVYSEDMEVEEEISWKLDRSEFVQKDDLTNELSSHTEDDMDGSSDDDEAIPTGKVASTPNDEVKIAAPPVRSVIQPFYQSLTSFGSLRLVNGTRRDGRANPHLASAIDRSGSTSDDSPHLGQMLPLERPENQANTPAVPKDFGSPPTLCSELGEVPVPLKPEARLGTGKAAPAASPFLLPPIWTPLALQALQDSAHRASNVATSQGSKVVTTAAIEDKAQAEGNAFPQELPRFSEVVSEEGLNTPKACGHSVGRKDVGKWSRGGRALRCEGERPESRGNGLKRALYLRVAGTGGGGGAGAFEEALLDDECSLFSCRFTSSLLRDVSVVDRGLQDPVAATLQQGDDMHFIPIREETSRPAPLQGSAFTCYTPL